MTLFHKYKIIILLIIFIIGLALRSVELLNKNYLFGFDQGNDYLAVRHMVEEKKLRLIGAEIGLGSAGINGIFQGPIYYYLLAIIYLLFKGNPYGSIVLMFIIGVLTLFCSYFIFKKVFNYSISTTIVFLIAISPPIISQSRFLWAPHPSTILIILSLFFLYLIPKKSDKYLPLSVFFATFIYNFEIAITIPLLLSIFASSYFIFKIKDLKSYFLSILVILLTISPTIIFEFRHNFMALRSIYNYIFTNNNGIQGISINSMYQHFRYYYFNLRNTFFHNSLYLPDFWKLISIISVFVPTFYFAYNHKKILNKDILKSNLLIVLITWIFFLFLNNTIWNHYLIHLNIIYIIIFSIIFYHYLHNYKKSTLNKLMLILNSIFIVILIIGSFQRLYKDYTYDYFDHGGPLKIKGKTELIDYVYNDAKKQKFNVLVFIPPVYTYPYDYMFLWYGQKKYGFIPGNEKQGLVYLLIEPDSEKPWSYIGWLETVIKTGRVISTVKLPSGFIVQKRYFD